MKKSRVLLVAIVAVVLFFLVYSPHFEYRFPLHIDEWHHISETTKLKNGEYPWGAGAYRIGFHILLLGLSSFMDLILFYKFLPALWAVVSALVLFYVVYKKTGNKFTIALFAMIFFASIKSNVNITGLWFFTPLVFSIPFIYLYVYFFSEGVEKENKKFILISLALMALVLFIHPISVLFSFPFLAIYCIMHRKYIKKEYKFFSVFLVLPIIGILFYTYLEEIPLSNALGSLVNSLKFTYGWGVLEEKNSFLEFYSFTGYILALLGVLALSIFNKNPKKYAVYTLWPATVLISIIMYRMGGVSYLAPYQRNLYYFTIGLPFLSAFGLYFLLRTLKPLSSKLKEPWIKKGAALAMIGIIVFLSFKSYYVLPENLKLYRLIDDNDYRALLFLSNIPRTKVMANPFVSTAIYPLSGHYPVGTVSFYGDRRLVERFFSGDCETKKQILEKRGDVEYVLSKGRIDCGWKLIYKANDFVYKV